MAGALTFLLIGCLLQGVQCGQWRVNMPPTIEVLRGSCVTIPCSFDIERRYNNYLDQTCKAVWRKSSNDEVVFDSKTSTNGELMGVLTDRDCTTTLNNMVSDDTYHFRLECENPLKYDFRNDVIKIVAKADPPSPTLTPSTLEVEEGTSVSLTCSAPAPCLSHPPTLTWSPRLGDSQETLQENEDKTKVQTSVLTFTASHLHHGRKISCTAVYRKQDGSPDSSVTTSLTADVSCVQCGQWRVNMPPTIEVLRGSCVTIPCYFDIESTYDNYLDQTCKAVWKKSSNDEVVFDSKTRTNGELMGVLTNGDCTTTLNNMVSDDTYHFRLECENPLKYDFRNDVIKIVAKADPPSPTLTPSTLEVEEGTSVSLTCSAPAPCLSHPPTLTWSPRLGDSQETLQENEDKTKVQTSVLTFTASHLHHGRKISCTAVYGKQDGSPDSSVTTSLTADVSCVQCGQWRVNMPPTIEVLRGSCVTIPCSFDIERRYNNYLDQTCKAVWKKSSNDEVVFDSKTRTNGELMGVLTDGDCTTTLNNMVSDDTYHFRLECENPLKYDFRNDVIKIVAKADPPSPTLTPSTLEVEEGTSVSLTCSAPAPCLSHPPTLTWSPRLGDSQETLQESEENTKVQTSVLTFTASHFHHGQKISCAAVYGKQDGSSQSSSSKTSALTVSSKHGGA